MGVNIIDIASVNHLLLSLVFSEIGRHKLLWIIAGLLRRFVGHSISDTNAFKLFTCIALREMPSAVTTSLLGIWLGAYALLVLAPNIVPVIQSDCVH